MISSLRLFFSSRYFCSLSFLLSLSFLIHVTNTPLSLFIQQRIQVTRTTTTDRQTVRQTNKQTHHAALRDMVHAQNGHTLFRFFFYILSTASLVKIGGGSVLLNLISLSFFSSLSLSLFPPRAGSTKMKKTPSEENSLPLPLVCVCVCVFVRLRIWRSLLSVRFWEWRRRRRTKKFSLFSLRQADRSEPKRTKE